MNLLSKAQILSAQDSPRHVVDVPEWGGSVSIQTMSGTDREKWESAAFQFQKNHTPQNIRAKLVAYCLVDEQGKRLFADAEIEALAAKSSKALERVFNECLRINGVTDEDVKELEKNSKSGQGAGS